MSIELFWPVVAVAALIFTQFVKSKVRPGYWQTKTGKQVLRLIPIAFGATACIVLGALGVTGARSIDVDALLGAGMGASAIALFHGHRAVRK